MHDGPFKTLLSPILITTQNLITLCHILRAYAESKLLGAVFRPLGCGIQSTLEDASCLVGLLHRIWSLWSNDMNMSTGRVAKNFWPRKSPPCRVGGVVDP